MNQLSNIDLSKPVQVYRNLNKPGCQFSVRQAGRVRCYVESIVLQDVRFKHASGKQLEAVRTGPRQVCQWITGIVSDAIVPADELTRVSCDPKTADGFTTGNEPIDRAAFCMVSKSGCFATLYWSN